MRYYDAHNHLQDDRLGTAQEAIVQECVQSGVSSMVVNGACAEDWPGVEALANRHPNVVIPSLGWHPWYLHEQEPGWEAEFERWLDRLPGAAVGEIGLDRWILDQPAAIRARYAPALAGIEPAPMARQIEVFRFQWESAVRRGRPASIHCLQCWGTLHDVIASGRGPAPGFLLHSYGGPVEMIERFARLGAYFSFPGYFLHERKARQREAFRKVPIERLLVETDAPDQMPPEGFRPFAVPAAADGSVLNHPANLPSIQAGLAAFLGHEPEAFAEQLEANFRRLFARVDWPTVPGCVAW